MSGFRVYNIFLRGINFQAQSLSEITKVFWLSDSSITFEVLTLPCCKLKNGRKTKIVLAYLVKTEPRQLKSLGTDAFIAFSLS